MLPIKGIQKTTLLDYPGKIASTIFLGGCNFRCPFCHNVSLVKDHESMTTIDETEMLTYMEGRTKQIEGICITGGEPTLAEDLPSFIKKLKAMGYAVKLDTNGSSPKMIKKLIDEQLIDYIAMDIKAPESFYDKASGVSTDMEKIKESIHLIKNSNIKYEFRTTIVPEIFPKDKTNELISLIDGADNYYLQQFENSVEILDPNWQDAPAYNKNELEEIAASVKKNIKNVKIRGIF